MQKIAIFVLCAIALFWALLTLSFQNLPQPWNIWGCYGFEVGKTYEATFVSDNPFREKTKPDTLTVKAIKGNFVQCKDGFSFNVESLWASAHKFKELK